MNPASHRSRECPLETPPLRAGIDRKDRGAAEGSDRRPRARGGGPGRAASAAPSGRTPPRARGWTQAAIVGEMVRMGFPADAEMNRPR